MTLRRIATGLATAIGLSALALPPTTTWAEETQYMAVPSSRVGPYSAMGTGYYGGIIDYMKYVNMNGGVNGVKLTWSECETEYNAARTVECFQRLLRGPDGQKMVVFDTLGTPGAYAVINRMREEEVVLAQYT
ncbi:ABC transporter substrate-binding protein, partial [Thiohalocapsa sp.]|uniref:ABC transporter substrate-binding protein n=1 Tax=Thiohalocapsa sp. TaxID=2497641 RepID=UPI0025EBFAF9